MYITVWNCSWHAVLCPFKTLLSSKTLCSRKISLSIYCSWLPEIPPQDTTHLMLKHSHYKYKCSQHAQFSWLRLFLPSFLRGNYTNDFDATTTGFCGRMTVLPFQCYINPDLQSNQQINVLHAPLHSQQMSLSRVCHDYSCQSQMLYLIII